MCPLTTTKWFSSGIPDLSTCQIFSATCCGDLGTNLSRISPFTLSDHQLAEILVGGHHDPAFSAR